MMAANQRPAPQDGGRLVAGCALVCAFTAWSCHRSPPGAAADAGGSNDSGAPSPEAAPAHARCMPAGGAQLPMLRGVEPGRATRTPDGFALGVTYSGQRDRTAAVLLTGEGRGDVRVVDVGAAGEDTLPPVPFMRGTELFALTDAPPAATADASAPGASGAAVRAGGRPARQLTVVRIAAGAVTPLATLAYAGDASPSFDVMASPGPDAPVFVAWDEDEPAKAAREATAPAGAAQPESGPAPGRVRVARLSADLRSVSSVDALTPPGVAAERPRLAAREGGAWLGWIVHTPEPPRDAAPELEAPGELPTYGALYAVALDATGHALGAPRPISSATGHVSDAVLAGGGGRLDAFLTKSDEAPGAAGGALLHGSVDKEGARLAARLRTAVGRSFVPVLGFERGKKGWIAYMDAEDRWRLAALDDSGAPMDGPGDDPQEPALDGAALLWGAPDAALAITTSEPPALRWLTCKL